MEKSANFPSLPLETDSIVNTGYNRKLAEVPEVSIGTYCRHRVSKTISKRINKKENNKNDEKRERENQNSLKEFHEKRQRTSEKPEEDKVMKFLAQVQQNSPLPNDVPSQNTPEGFWNTTFPETQTVKGTWVRKETESDF